MTIRPNSLDREKAFHDQWAANIDVDAIDVAVFFEGATAPENRYILSKLGDIKEKYLLDVGCGAGESTVYFARKGARCVAGDWSSGMLEKARQLAKRHGVSVETHVVNAMAMDFPDNTFDIVYVSNILHHVDENKALSEIHRVLKPGGVACIWEPLRHNPIINIYRMIATQVRTEDEHPLDIRFVRQAKALFGHVEWDSFWLASLWILIRFYLIERSDPNKERYWKKIYYEEPRLRDTYLRLERLDRLIKKIPYLKKFAWTLAIVAWK